MMAVSMLAAITCSWTRSPAAFREKALHRGRTAWTVAVPSCGRSEAATQSPVPGNSETRAVCRRNLPETSAESSPQSVRMMHRSRCAATTRAGQGRPGHGVETGYRVGCSSRWIKAATKKAAMGIPPCTTPRRAYSARRGIKSGRKSYLGEPLRTELLRGTLRTDFICSTLLSPSGFRSETILNQYRSDNSRAELPRSSTVLSPLGGEPRREDTPMTSQSMA